MKTKHVNPKNEERGAIVLLMAVTLVALIGIASFAIDIGAALVTKAELQNVADSAALASTNRMASFYKLMGPDEQLSLTSAQVEVVKDVAETFAEANKVTGVEDLDFRMADMIIGTYDLAAGTVSAAASLQRAVLVTGRRDNLANKPMATTLARVLGINEIGVSSRTGAALSGVSKLKAGKAEFPIGIDEGWFTSDLSHNCAAGAPVYLSPTSMASCAGWHTFTEPSPDAKALMLIGIAIANGTFESPAMKAGDPFYFIGGEVTSALMKLEDAFMKKTKNRTVPWHTTVPVYEKQRDCRNPGGPIKIVGFVNVEVLNVDSRAHGGTGEVTVDLECGILDEDDTGPGGGGGPDFGVLVSSPGVIQ